MRNELSFVTSDRGQVRITPQMMMADGVFEKLADLQNIALIGFPHLQFWISEDIPGRDRIISWEPKT